MNFNRQKLFYEKNGFVILRNAFSKTKVNKILKEVEFLKERVEEIGNNKYFHKTDDGKFNSLHNVQKYAKRGEIFKISKNTKLKKLLYEIFKKKTKVRNIEFFLKPAKKGLSTPFHQDNFYWNILNDKSLNVWIACSKANKKNGGICYLMGSHKLGTINHEISFAKGSSQKIPDKIMSKLNFKRIFPRLGIGDCILHHSNVIHGSKKNLSKFDRIGLAISFATIGFKIDKQKNAEYKRSLIKNLKKIYN